MKENNNITKFETFIIFCLIGIVPFVVGATTYSMPQMGADGSAAAMFDYFNYIKVGIIKLMAILIVFDFGAGVLTGTLKFNIKKIDFKKLDKRYIFIIIMAISTIIAFLVSDYKKTALFGAYERFEGMWVHFAYMIIFIYAIKVFKKVGAFDVITWSTLVSTFIVGGIGTLQFLNVDVFNSEFMKALTYKNYDIQITMPGSFTTMYNTNTSGAYAVLMMFLLSIIFVIAKKGYVKVMAVVDFVFVTITFLNSYSEASYISFIGGLSVLLLIYLVVLFSKKDYKKCGIIAGITAILVIVIGVVALNNDKVINLLERFEGPVATFTDWSQDGNNFYFYNKDDDYLEFELLDDEYNIYEGENLIFTEPYETNNIDVLTTLDTNNFGNEVQVGITTSPLDQQNYINFNNYFYIRYNDQPAIVNMDTLEEAVHYDFIGFEGYGNLFTNRGYIWSYSLPLILQHPLGVGSDVFFKIFPNDNFVGEAFYNQPDVTIDKPHNLYMDMAINNGILYLVGFIGIVVLSFKDKFKLIVSKENVNKKAIALYIAGISTFLINVLATDSLVVLTMLFWLLLALSKENFELEFNTNKKINGSKKYNKTIKEESSRKNSNITKNSKNVKTNAKTIEQNKSSKNNKREKSKNKVMIDDDVDTVNNKKIDDTTHKETIKADIDVNNKNTSNDVFKNLESIEEIIDDTQEIDYDKIGFSYSEIIEQDKKKK